MIEQDSFTNTPSWKNQLVASDEEARVFFEGQLIEHNIEASIDTWEIVPYRNGSLKIGIFVKSNRPPSPTEPDHAFYAASWIQPNDRCLLIEGFGVSPSPFGMRYQNDPFRNKNISFIGLKSLIGIANQHCPDLSFISLKEVEEDGPRFWHYLGGLAIDNGYCPEAVGRDLDNELSRALTEFNEHRKQKRAELKQYGPSSERWHQLSVQWLDADDALLGTERYRQLLESRDMAKEYPASAMRLLAKIKRSEKKPEDKIDAVCSEVFKHLCRTSDKSMIINLKDPGTLNIMRERLGTLPCCPVPVSFGPASCEAAKKSGDKAFFDRYRRYDNLNRHRRNKNGTYAP